MRKLAIFCGSVFAVTVALAQQPATPATAAAAKPWIARSDSYTHQLIDVQFKHGPEGGSQEGLAEFDPLISDPSLADQRIQRRELEAVLARLKIAESTEKDENVLEDLVILRKAMELQFREEDYDEQHDVDFFNASEMVFGGLRILLDDQVAAGRRPAALIRLRKYAGIEPGFQPFTEILKQRTLAQMAKPGVLFPSKGEMETELGRDQNYIDGVPALFKKYKLTGWEADFEKLKAQLIAYDTWLRADVLPKARTDFRLPAAEYTLDLEAYGIDVPPEQLAAKAHAAFIQYQSEMAPLAAQIAKAHGWPSSDYRDVIHQLKKDQITGEAILPFYQARLKAIEEIIAAQHLVTLPNRPAIIRIATQAETAAQPAPHEDSPALLHNTGERGEFVLPLNIPGVNGAADEKYDDFNFDAVSWSLTAHEARPGHELQFDSMVENGVSTARILYAFNSTNVEGWGLYSEYIMQPYEPVEGQLLTLQFRLLRAARAFTDPELQSGKMTPDDAYRLLEMDVCLSHAYAKEEVERFTYRMPGQANSYFYGYSKLLDLRRDVEAALGTKFSALKFHDFILAQGLLPPDLMRKAVMEDFVPSQL
jgi:Bacterial protein of unknown function (DUF885)